MRKWHRWLSLFFGVFMVWIAATGVLSQVVPLIERGGSGAQGSGPGAPGGPAASATIPGAPAGFECPETMTCRPKNRGPGGSIVGTLHHLHSGESFGPVGVVIATLSGLALTFFSFSGLWMYVQLWRSRASRELTPRWFW